MVRVFTIAAGVILILTGVFCFANPGATFLSIAFLLGCAMLLSGISEASAYIWISRKKEISNLLLVEGLLSVILGILVLSNQLLADAAIPVFFGMWVMFSGVIRIVEAYSHRKSGRMELIWLLSLGLLGIAGGLYAFFNTVLFTFSPIMLVGILFVVQGINVLLVGVNLTFHRRGHHR
jgi:membrane protein HdeD